MLVIVIVIVIVVVVVKVLVIAAVDAMVKSVKFAFFKQKNVLTWS